MISLTPELADLVRKEVVSGAYTSEEAVLRAALQALADRRAEDLASIRRGLADFEAGRFKSAEASEAECRARFGLEETL